MSFPLLPTLVPSQDRAMKRQNNICIPQNGEIIKTILNLVNNSEITSKDLTNNGQKILNTIKMKV